MLIILGAEAHADYLFYPVTVKNSFFLGAGMATGWMEDILSPQGGYYFGPHVCFGSRFDTPGGGYRFWKVGVVQPNPIHTGGYRRGHFDHLFLNATFGILF